MPKFSSICSLNTNQDAFYNLHATIDLAFWGTKVMIQVIGKASTSLVVLKNYLLINLTELKDVEKIPYLNLPVSQKGLFG